MSFEGLGNWCRLRVVFSYCSQLGLNIWIFWVVNSYSWFSSINIHLTFKPNSKRAKSFSQCWQSSLLSLQGFSRLFHSKLKFFRGKKDWIKTKNLICLEIKCTAHVPFNLCFILLTYNVWPTLYLELTWRYKMFLWVQESLPAPKARTGGRVAPGVPHTTLDEAHLHMDGMERKSWIRQLKIRFNLSYH